MARLAPDRVSMLAERLDRLILRWLDTLPAAGWQGTPTEAAAGLAAVATYGTGCSRTPAGCWPSTPACCAGTGGRCRSGGPAGAAGSASTGPRGDKTNSRGQPTGSPAVGTGRRAEGPRAQALAGRVSFQFSFVRAGALR